MISTKNFTIVAAAAFFAMVLTMMPEMSFAQETGSNAISDIKGVISGNIGTLIGLGIALLGLYTWLVQQSSWGIVMIVGGVAVTAFPGIFSSMQGGFASLFSSSGATASDSTGLAN